MAQVVAVLAPPHDPTLAGMVKGNPDVESAQRIWANVERLRADLDAAKPDSIVMVGGDHLNQWFMNNMPAFAIGKAPRAKGPFADEVKAFGITEYDVPTDGELARHLLADGLARGVDYSYTDEYTLDHAFTVPLDLLRPQQDLPVVPVFTNILAPPLASATRFQAVGQTLRQSIETWDADRRVAVLVTGHMTNNVGGPRMLDVFREPLSEWDKRTWALIEAWDLDKIVSEATWENLNEAGHATPAFLDFIFGFGVARGVKPTWCDLVAHPLSPSIATFAWDETALKEAAA